ncbi:MAG: FHA domain-containing protein [Rhizomicrobium sp.]
MAVIRGPSGKNNSEDTYRVRDTKTADPYGEKTVIARPISDNPAIAAKTGPMADSSEKTHVVGTRSSNPSPQSRDFLNDPVVGWLVIIDGPGKGQSLKIGYGQNSIGRSATQRIRIDFGDEQVSRDGHAFITYDPKGRKFYVQNGGGSNLIYIGDSPVLVPTEILDQTELSLGKTVLRFVPFCGSGFDWQGPGNIPA